MTPLFEAIDRRRPQYRQRTGLGDTIPMRWRPSMVKPTPLVVPKKNQGPDYICVTSDCCTFQHVVCNKQDTMFVQQQALDVQNNSGYPLQKLQVRKNRIDSIQRHSHGMDPRKGAIGNGLLSQSGPGFICAWLQSQPNGCQLRGRRKLLEDLANVINGTLIRTGGSVASITPGGCHG